MQRSRAAAQKAGLAPTRRFRVFEAIAECRLGAARVAERPTEARLLRKNGFRRGKTMSFTPGRLSDVAYGLMRFVFGVLYACHGAQKLFGAFGGPVMTHSTVYLAAGVIEFFGGILIAVGLMTRPAAFLASGEMAVAYFWKHAPNGLWPIQNK